MKISKINKKNNQKFYKINISFDLLKLISKEVFYNESLWRTLMNYSLSVVKLSGNIIDLGGGSLDSTYHGYIRYKQPYRITTSDFYKTAPNIIKLDLEKKFHIQNNKFDNITCFNVLEHIYNYKNTIRESYRILKKKGLFIGSTPFLLNFHPSPNDYFRYSHQSILRMFEEEGFDCKKIIFIGFGPLSASISQSIFLLPRFLRPLLLIPLILIDFIINKYSDYYRNKYALGYVYIFQK